MGSADLKVVIAWKFFDVIFCGSWLDHSNRKTDPYLQTENLAFACIRSLSFLNWQQRFHKNCPQSHHGCFVILCLNVEFNSWEMEYHHHRSSSYIIIILLLFVLEPRLLLKFSAQTLHVIKCSKSGLFKVMQYERKKNED